MINESKVRALLRRARSGGRHAETELIQALRKRPFDDLGFAKLDNHRRLRRGIPEVVLCEGKTPDQLIRILKRMSGWGDLILLTRLEASVFEAIRGAHSSLRYHPVARIAYALPAANGKPRRAVRKGQVTVLSGGTSDLPVAEEAAVTLELLGSRTTRLYDVGVAGLHRLLEYWDLLQRSRVLVVVAGMEGALASVASGLVRAPVVAVPTSVGYGASFQGLAPLLAMLNSCSPGIGVVNIDNGFGAAYLAHQINAL